MTTTAALLVALLLLPVLILLWATESRSQRIRRLAKAGYSQRAIASRLGVTRYQVRRSLATA